MLYLILGMAYWTVVISFFAVIVGAALTDRTDATHLAMAFAMSLFWPLTTLLGSIATVYGIFVKSGSRIRADLRNRKLLREFDEWVRNKE